MQQGCYIDEEASSKQTGSQMKSPGRIMVNNHNCSEELQHVLDDMHFRDKDFWVGFKLYCYGHYSHCAISREQFLASKMGRVTVFLLQKEKVVLRGARFDDMVRQVWVKTEEYIKIRYNKDCTNLRALMEEFDNEQELSTSENGSLLLQLVKDEEHAGTEHLNHRQAPGHVQIQSTDVFDEFWRSLRRVDSDLDKLLKNRQTGLNHG